MMTINHTITVHSFVYPATSSELDQPPQANFLYLSCHPINSTKEIVTLPSLFSGLIIIYKISYDHLTIRFILGLS